MSDIISFNLPSTASRVQVYLREFCAISNPETATPPAFEALPGAYKILFFINNSTASGVHGILAPSPTVEHPFFIKESASFKSSSF